MLNFHQLWQSGLWLAAAALNGLALLGGWAHFAQVRPGRFWKAALFCTLAIASIAVIWIGDPNLLYTLPFFLLMGLLCTRGPWAGRLAVTVIFFTLIMSISAILDTYLELLDAQTGFSQLLRPLFYGGLYLLLRRRLPEQPPSLSGRLWNLVLGLAAMPLCALIAVVLLTTRKYESSAVNAVALNQGLVVLPFALFTSLMLLLAISVLAHQERLERASQLASLRETYYQSLQQQETQVRRLRHDLRNHLTVLQGLLEAGKTHQALDYLHQMCGSPALQPGGRICENETANVVLSAKREELERQGIAADFEVSLPEKLPVADTDLCALLGNALDNAMEGVQGVSDPRVTLRCKADKGLFMLRVLNPVGGTVHPDLSTTKANKQAHGFGLPGMEEIAQRYHGTLEAGVRNGRFELVICFPIPQNPN